MTFNYKFHKTFIVELSVKPRASQIRGGQQSELGNLAESGSRVSWVAAESGSNRVSFGQGRQSSVSGAGQRQLLTNKEHLVPRGAHLACPLELEGTFHAVIL